MTRVVLDGKTYYMLPEDEYERMRQQLREDGQRQMNRTDIAKLLGISRQRLSECPWLLPYFGKGMRHRRNVTWSEREVTEHLRKSPQQLEEEYDACYRHREDA